MERDPLRVDDLVRRVNNRKGKQAEQEVYFLYTEEEVTDQGAARLSSRLECLRIEAEKRFARFDAEEVERE